MGFAGGGADWGRSGLRDRDSKVAIGTGYVQNYLSWRSAGCSRLSLLPALPTTVRAGTLRLAIAEVNGTPGNNTIQFDPIVFHSIQTITLTASQLELSNTAGTQTMIGPAAGVIVSGGNLTRVLQVNKGVTTSISGLTFTKGNASTGAGLYNLGNSTLTDCTIAVTSVTSRTVAAAVCSMWAQLALRAVPLAVTWVVLAAASKMAAERFPWRIARSVLTTLPILAAAFTSNKVRPRSRAAPSAATVTRMAAVWPIKRRSPWRTASSKTIPAVEWTI